MKKLISLLLTLAIVVSLVAAAPTAETSAKKKAKTETTAVLSEEASRFTIDTWKPTYGNWSKKKIEKAANRGTGANLFDKYGKLYDLELAHDRQFVDICINIGMFTCEGRYGYIEDKNDELCRYLQDKIKTVADLWLYLLLTGYSYFEDDQGFMTASVNSWNMQNDARINILDNGGVCCHTAMVLSYLLEDDYEETGFVVVHSSRGHMYGYVKDKGVYYYVDFTDFTSDHYEMRNTLIRILDQREQEWTEEQDFKQNVKHFDDLYNTYKESICFWSGKSLNSASATKAALIHDTYEDGNTRKDLSWYWTDRNTGNIFAVRYYKGMNGSCVSFLQDTCNAINSPDSYDIRWKNRHYKLNYFGVALPEYTWYQMLYLDPVGKWVGSPFKEIAPIELRLVPWYCDISPEAQALVDSQETYLEKMYRQTSFGLEKSVEISWKDGSKTWMGRSYNNAQNPFNTEMRIGALWAYQRGVDHEMGAEGRGLSLDEFFASIPGFEKMYGYIDLVER